MMINADTLTQQTFKKTRMIFLVIRQEFDTKKHIKSANVF